MSSAPAVLIVDLLAGSLQLGGEALHLVALAAQSVAELVALRLQGGERLAPRPQLPLHVGSPALLFVDGLLRPLQLLLQAAPLVLDIVDPGASLLERLPVDLSRPAELVELGPEVVGELPGFQAGLPGPSQLGLQVGTPPVLLGQRAPQLFQRGVSLGDSLRLGRRLLAGSLQLPLQVGTLPFAGRDGALCLVQLPFQLGDAHQSFANPGACLLELAAPRLQVPAQRLGPRLLLAETYLARLEAPARFLQRPIPLADRLLEATQQPLALLLLELQRLHGLLALLQALAGLLRSQSEPCQLLLQLAFVLPGDRELSLQLVAARPNLLQLATPLIAGQNSIGPRQLELAVASLGLGN